MPLRVRLSESFENVARLNPDLCIEQSANVAWDHCPEHVSAMVVRIQVLRHAFRLTNLL